ncbi:hypothetical protein EMIT0194P_20491 [Pseudomonas serbica]
MVPLALFLFWPPWLTQRLHLKDGLIFGKESGCGYGEEGQKEAGGVSGPVGQAVALKFHEGKSSVTSDINRCWYGAVRHYRR